MSIETSEIITAMTHQWQQSMIELHNRYMNDMQSLLSKFEMRVIADIESISLRVIALEEQSDRSGQP